MSDTEAQTNLSTLPIWLEGLSIVQGLFAHLHDEDVVYCHWKSNEHLGAAIDGLTDLDVLVDRHRTSDLQRILAESGFRRFVAPPLRAYPAVEDYIGFDNITGRLVHLHLHYQLTLGQRHLKGYRLPWESQVLATRVLHPRYGVYTSDPAMELLLLLVRAALKQRMRDRIRPYFRKSPKSHSADFQREFAWLRERTNKVAVCEMARKLLGPVAQDLLCNLIDDPNIQTRLLAFASALRPILRRYQTYGPIGARLRMVLRELHWIANVVTRRHLNDPTPHRRISPRGGAVIVLLGSDGAGKSSLSATLVSWLGAKLDVIPIYFGSGDGPSSVIRLPLVFARRVFGRTSKKSNRGKLGSGLKGTACPTEASQPPRGLMRKAAVILWALALSLEKRGKLRRMVRARNRSMIVVCDRFAQADVAGFNDGPLLSHWGHSEWWICRALAAWEAKPHSEAKFDPPDLVMKLNVTPEVAQTRRPEMTLEELRRRVQAVHGLRFPESAKVVEIGADVPFDEVTLTAKRHVWSVL